MAARLLGDDTAERQGRLTLNPIRHLDPFGTLMIVMTTLTGLAGIGWGKPVPVNGAALRTGRSGMAVVSAAGPLSNLVMALVSAIAVVQLGLLRQAEPAWWAELLVMLMFVNVGLAAFNLLPIPPLDGFGVLVGLAPPQVVHQLRWLGQYGPGILLILVFSGSLLPRALTGGRSLLSLILDPVRDVLLNVILRIAALF